MRGHDLVEEVKYKWKHDFVTHGVDVQSCGERIASLMSRLGRRPQPKDIYEDAKSKDAPYHDFVFGISDDEVIERWRIKRCQSLLINIETIDIPSKTVDFVDEGEIEIADAPSTPLVTHVPGMGYMDTAAVHQNDVLRNLALQEMLRNFSAWEAKIARFKTLTRYFDFGGARKEVEKLMSSGAKAPKSRRTKHAKKSRKKGRR